MRLLNHTFRVPNALVEGWGMTADPSTVNSNGYYTMYMTDGTHYIFVVDGETMQIIKEIKV